MNDVQNARLQDLQEQRCNLMRLAPKHTTRINRCFQFDGVSGHRFYFTKGNDGCVTYITFYKIALSHLWSVTLAGSDINKP